MRFTMKDGVATALVAAIVVPYIGYVINDEMPFIQDARGMGVTGLVLGTIAWFILGADAFGPRWFAIGGGVVAVALGVTAAVLETGLASSLFLGAFVAAIVVMWAAAMWRHAKMHTGGASGLTARHA